MPAVVSIKGRVLVILLCLVSIACVSPASAAEQLSLPADVLQKKPNELGRVPVLMYHNIVAPDTFRDPSVDPYMYRTYDEFWGDMLWLYENDFYLIGMNELISGDIDIPAGKHPVVFTFDDSSNMHFSAKKLDDGTLDIDPNCAVGLMEKFHKEHPDFGRGAYFAIVPGNGFSWPDFEEDDLFEDKVRWLAENHYEIGNHTLSHPDLSNISDDNFAWTVAGPVLWADELIGQDHPMNATRVLTLPFGIRPQPENNPGKVSMIEYGFHYEDQPIRLTGVLELTGGSSEVPWSMEWDALSIPRLPVQDDVLDMVKSVYLEGEDPYYTSDGDVNAVTVPWPLPKSQWDKLNKEAIGESGKSFVKYHPDTGRIFASSMGPQPAVAWLVVEED